MGLSEKGFCTLLTEQIIDERKATRAYKRLLDYFKDERDLLISGPETGSWARINIANNLDKDIDLIVKDEIIHETILERIRHILCEVKE